MPNTPETSPETTSVAAAKSWLPLWLFLSVLWGFSFLFIKVVNDFLDPYQTTFARLALGAFTLFISVLVTGRKLLLRGPAIKHLFFIAILSQSIPFTLFAWAEHDISSIAAGLMNSMMSLWTALLAVAILPEEKLNRNRFTGILIGFVGVTVLLGVWNADFHASWMSYAACALATVGYAISALWTRRFITPMHLDPMSAVTTQLTIGALAVGAVSLFTSAAPTHYPAVGLLSIFLLGAFGTGIALVVNFQLIKVAGAMATSTVTYSIPIVATIVGVVILREKLHWYEPIGAAIILLGIALVQEMIGKQKAKA